MVKQCKALTVAGEYNQRFRVQELLASYSPAKLASQADHGLNARGTLCFIRL